MIHAIEFLQQVGEASEVDARAPYEVGRHAVVDGGGGAGLGQVRGHVDVLGVLALDVAEEAPHLLQLCLRGRVRVDDRVEAVGPEVAGFPEQ